MIYVYWSSGYNDPLPAQRKVEDKRLWGMEMVWKNGAMVAVSVGGLVVLVVGLTYITRATQTEQRIESRAAYLTPTPSPTPTPRTDLMR